MAKRNAISPDYRRAVALRCLAAVTGGFAATSALCILLALLLIESGAMPRGEATATVTLVSFALWTALICWAFTTANLRRVWLNLMVPAVAAGLAAMLLVLAR